MPSYRFIFYFCFALLIGLLFVMNTDEMAGINLAVLTAVQIHPTGGLDDFSLFMAFIGGPFMSLIFIGILCIGFLLRKRIRAMVLFLTLFVLLTGFEAVSKMVLFHPRPTIEFVRKTQPVGWFKKLPDISMPSNNSFPSGHCMRAVFLMCIAGTLAGVGSSRGKKILAVLVTVYCLGAGFARVYLGAHWPSDVLAGFLLGVMGWMAYLKAVHPPGKVIQACALLLLVSVFSGCADLESYDNTPSNWDKNDPSAKNKITSGNQYDEAAIKRELMPTDKDRFDPWK